MNTFLLKPLILFHSVTITMITVSSNSACFQDRISGLWFYLSDNSFLVTPGFPILFRTVFICNFPLLPFQNCHSLFYTTECEERRASTQAQSFCVASFATLVIAF